jgi:hypothetical protein
MTYAFSTPSAFTFLMIVPMFLRSFGYSITAMRFLQRKPLILSAFARRDDFDFLFSSMSNMSGRQLKDTLDVGSKVTVRWVPADLRVRCAPCSGSSEWVQGSRQSLLDVVGAELADAVQLNDHEFNDR